MNIDQKIKNILKDLEIANKKTEKFLGYRINVNDPIRPATNIYEMGVAYDNRERILMDFELALAEKFPQHYSEEEIEYITKERDRLSRNVRAWQNQQFPSQYRE